MIWEIQVWASNTNFLEIGPLRLRAEVTQRSGRNRYGVTGLARR